VKQPSPGQLRLRPILMTSFAFHLGWACRCGSHLVRAPLDAGDLGTVVITGMLAATRHRIFYDSHALCGVEKIVPRPHAPYAAQTHHHERNHPSPRRPMI